MRALQIDPRDNLAVALHDLPAGGEVDLGGRAFRLAEAVPAKQKFTLEPFPAGHRAVMYGITVGEATHQIASGGLVHTGNLVHRTDTYAAEPSEPFQWTPPDVSLWRDRTFLGYPRSDGSAGTANHWLVVPMVFCENRNVEALRSAFERTLGYGRTTHYEDFARSLVEAHKTGSTPEELRGMSLESGFASAGGKTTYPPPERRPFPRIDGIQFLTHAMGCGGTRDDTRALCGLLAGYITHPNVAGATVLSLGCEIAQLELLREEIDRRAPGFDKPLLTFRQQSHSSERSLMEAAMRETFAALVEADRIERRSFPLDRLTLGMECGGSDGFSGLSANPVVGAVADRIVALGGKVILSEFPELCGVEQDLVNRCVDGKTAEHFARLSRAYAERARAVGSDFSQNPSPGNIRDGLVTDAIKSAGAAKKGGTSPVVDVLDYPERVSKPGLSLLCTPGGDVESTTAMAGAHANLILFTTGLGTPTGNPVCPVVKISSNSELAARLPDLIDFDAGGVIDGTRSIEDLSENLLEQIVATASGECPTKAQLLGQNDFQPWKRGVSL